jgi:hypothetical protein
VTAEVEEGQSNDRESRGGSGGGGGEGGGEDLKKAFQDAERLRAGLEMPQEV